jgi:hypothetical protein
MIGEWSSKRKARVLELWAMSSGDLGDSGLDEAEGRMKRGVTGECRRSMTRFSKVDFSVLTLCPAMETWCPGETCL